MSNWKKLSPHLPVAEDEPTYVARPFDDGAARLAMKLRANIGPIAVAGPVGCGKSTELAATVRLLMPDTEGLLIRLDRQENLRGGRAMDVARGAVRLLLEAMHEDLHTNVPGLGGWEAFSELDELLVGARLLKKRVQPREVAFLFDGLEKMQVQDAFAVVKSILSLREEARLIIVVPLTLVTGPETHALNSEGVRLFPIRAVPVGQDTREGECFLKAIAMQKLGVSELPPGLDEIFELAARASGGLARTFLQILQDAAGYASLEQREAPLREDLRNAVQDHMESFQRLLREGDRKALSEANGTDGLEVPLDRRLRLLSHGILLEYSGPEGQAVVQQHPLTRPTILKELGLA
jgi:energy-coupling factor transporter ATP-binding protein EcfA2